MNFLKLLCIIISIFNCPLLAMDQAASSSSPSVQRKTCNICFATKRAKKFTTLLCGHNKYCTKCLKELTKANLKDKSLTSVRCPHSTCKQPLCESDIRSITKNSMETLAAFADAGTNDVLNTHPHAKRCPTADCPYAFINDGQYAQTMQCPSCTQSYCTRCLINHPKKVSCELAKKNRPIDPKTSDWLQNHTKKCPSCTTRIEKNSGCDHMTCKKCNHEFCWKCKTPYRSADGNQAHPNFCDRDAIFRQDDDLLRPDAVARLNRWNDTCLSGCIPATGLGICCLLCIGSFMPSLLPPKTPTQFISQYQPGFEKFDYLQKMATTYCPNSLASGPEHQEMPVCDQIKTIQLGSELYHNTMRQKLHNAYPYTYLKADKIYSDRHPLIANSRKHNLALIALAKENNGCIEESKKTK